LPPHSIGFERLYRRDVSLVELSDQDDHRKA
jgi:hypothetical protein